MSEVTDSRELLPALGRVPGHVFWRASARIGLTAAETLPTDLDLTAYASLHALDDGAGRTQQEIADAVAVSRTTMVKVAADLAAERLVVRERNPADRRSYVLTRTRAGADVLRRWDADVDRLEQVATRPYAAAERDRLHARLLRLAQGALSPELPAAVRDRVCLLLPRLHAWLHREFSAALEPVGVEPRHVGALIALESLGPVPQVEASRAVGVSAASAVAIVDELEERGLVERRRAPEDRRTQVLHATAAAAELLPRVQTIGAEVAGRILVALDAAELDDLLDLLRRLVTDPLPASRR